MKSNLRKISYFFILITLVVFAGSLVTVKVFAAEVDGSPALQLDTFMPLTPTPTQAPYPNPSVCGKDLWRHVHGWAPRMRLIKACVTVRAKVLRIADNDDGDVHVKLQVDKPYQRQVSGRARLSAEIICEHTPKDRKAKKACKGYRNRLAVPKKGDYIEITGAHVRDSHGLYEIHPVNSIRKL